MDDIREGKAAAACPLVLIKWNILVLVICSRFLPRFWSVSLPCLADVLNNELILYWLPESVPTVCSFVQASPCSIGCPHGGRGRRGAFL